MAVLVTGGAGFIGSHLVERLLEQSVGEIVILDDLNPFYDPELKRKNLSGIESHPAVTFVEGDVSDADLVDSVWAKHRIEKLIHLAAHAGVRPSLDKPLPYVDANVRGTLVLLEAARRYGCRRFLNASSATVYGNDAPVPFQEDRLGLVPASPYGVTKRSAELLCRMYHDLYDVPTVSLRFFSVYGPRLRPDLALTIFTDAICHGRPLPLIGGGTARRDFTFITDIVDGISGALDGEFAGQEVNLGNEHPVEVRQLISTIEQAVGKPAQIDQLPEKPGEMEITCADVTRARKLFGYNPTTSIQEGVAAYVEWFLRQSGS